MFKEMEGDTGFWDAVKTKIDSKSFFSGLINRYAGKVTGGDASEYFHELRVAKKAAFLDEFTNLVEKLIESYCAKFGAKKEEKDTEGAFVIFIDDLDRCPPGRVLQVLEAIKLFLGIPGCIFFLGMEVDRVKEAIQSKYVEEQKRKKFEPGRYLEKIFQIHVKIPPVALPNMESFINQLFKKFEKKKDYDEVKEIFLAANFDTQRALKRAINDFLFLENLSFRMDDLELGK